jgi:hypothetical protein
VPYSRRLIAPLAEAGDFVVLGGEPGQCLGAEAGELGDCRVLAADALPEGAGFVFSRLIWASRGSGVSPALCMAASRASNSSRRWA